MARIAGINIPQDKVVHVALTYIYGIGNFNSKVICEKLNIPFNKRVNSLSEEEVLKIVKSKPIKSYFLLDVEMPYIYFSSKHGNKNMAIRFSEYESLKTVEYFTKLVSGTPTVSKYSI